jgi:hypothetical protein
MLSQKLIPQDVTDEVGPRKAMSGEEVKKDESRAMKIIVRLISGLAMVGWLVLATEGLSLVLGLSFMHDLCIDIICSSLIPHNTNRLGSLWLVYTWGTSMSVALSRWWKYYW